MNDAVVPALDAVVTWVDNSDPTWLRAHRRYSAKEGTAAARSDGAAPNGACYRDGGLLRYCLRSIHEHLPWIRRIYLVTAGHRPSFLKPDQERITCISHAEIFPSPGDLPTFNSMAIECHLHRISALSEFFIYFNDDVFALAPLAASDFVTADGGHVLPFEDFPLPTSLLAPETVDRSLAFTNLLLAARFGADPGRKLIAHAPQVYDRRWIANLWSTWETELQKTSAHRFRLSGSIALRALYYHSIRETPEDARPHFARHAKYPELCLAAPRYRFLWTRGEIGDFESALAQVNGEPTTFLCINDAADDPHDAEAKLRIAREWLELRFPRPAPWECA